MLGNLKGQDPMEVLGATAGRLRRYVRDAPIDVLRQRPAADKWCGVEIIAHLADVEIVMGWRFRLILAHDGVAVQAFDQDEWVRNLRYEDTDPAESVDQFEPARKANLQLLRRVEPSRLANHGVHPERGRETVAQLVRLVAGHDLNHLAQLDDLVRARDAAPTSLRRG
jgi:hypothetical protein